MTSPRDKANPAVKNAPVQGRHLSEFSIIEKFFAPLTDKDPLAFALKDDAAIIHPARGMDLVVTVDGMVAGIHFLQDDPPEEIARKLLRVNMSDLAAKGAEPLSYVLTCAWPRNHSADWIERFAQGLAKDQQCFGVHLIGGDTVATEGPLTLSLTAFGQVRAGQMIKRSGALPGDLVYVSGSIGGGAAGLRVARGELSEIDEAGRGVLLQHYRLPEPRLSLGRRLQGLAHACADVSDGLLADAAHVGEASGVKMVINLEAVPFLTQAVSAGLDKRALITGGDDYELLFTLAEDAAGEISTVAAETGVALTAIGRVETGEGVCLYDDQGREIEMRQTGYKHF